MIDTILLIVGILGFGAVVIAAYVFYVAAQNEVMSQDNSTALVSDMVLRAKSFTPRNPADRRQNNQSAFPFTLNGILISEDRRQTTDRRFAAA